MSSVIAYDIKQNRMDVEEDADLSAAKTILDVDNDSLEYVFDFLGFSDLINVAEANKHLKVASEIVFLRKLNKGKIVIHIDKHLHRGIYIFNDAILIHELPLAVRAIRLFGQSTSELSLRLRTDASVSEKTLVHINEYCHKTLKILHISGNPSEMIGALKYSFENVEKVSLAISTVGPGYEQINRTFPRLRQLILTEQCIMDSNCHLHSFPNSHTFYSEGSNYGDRTPTDYDLKAIVASDFRPQNFHVIGSGYGNPSIWEPINAGLKNLKSICATFSSENTESLKGQKLVFNCVESFYVESTSVFEYDHFNPLDVFSFRRLKKLTVYFSEGCLGLWLDFILANPTIKELEIGIFGRDNWEFISLEFEENREKLSKMSQNVEFILLRIDSQGLRSYSGVDLSMDQINELPIFSDEPHWFTKFSVYFDYGDYNIAISEMERFVQKIAGKLRIKNYKSKKCIMASKCIPTDFCYYDIFVDFEKCE